jgi:NitT/TauT family transport system ATP-binding protein
MSDRVLVMGLSPGRLEAEYRVDLPRPRHEDMITTPEFIGLQRAIIRTIREQSRAVAGATA